VEARGKWLLMHFSGGATLATHMLMSGSWHIYRPGEAWKRGRYHMRIVIATRTILAVAFDVPVAEFHTERSLARRPGFNRLGPDVLVDDFDHLEIPPDLEIGVALLTQSIIAGLGNVYKSEVCFLAQVNPFRTAGELTRVQIENVVSLAKKLMRANVGDEAKAQIVTYTGLRRTTGRSDQSERLWVYKRSGEPCRKCGTAILSHKQGSDARVTFWCPVCQP
jgi:endonuclease-8